MAASSSRMIGRDTAGSESCSKPRRPVLRHMRHMLELALDQFRVRHFNPRLLYRR